MKAIYILIFIFLISGRIDAQSNIFSPEHYTIIDTGKYKAFVKNCQAYQPPVQGAREISSEEINMLEYRFKSIYRYYRGNELNDLSNYIYQYLGIWKNGQPCIFINALPKNTLAILEKQKWRTEPLSVCDGENWRAIFDVKTKQFVYLEL